MKTLDMLAWKASIFFIAFELSLWIFGEKVFFALYYMIKNNVSFISSHDTSGIFYSWKEAFLSIIFIFSSIYFFKQFILNAARMIREVAK